MSKTMQNIILIMDDPRCAYRTPQKSGNSFMNRFSVDEDAAFEIIGIHHLKTHDLTYQQSYGAYRASFQPPKNSKGTEKCLP